MDRSGGFSMGLSGGFSMGLSNGFSVLLSGGFSKGVSGGFRMGLSNSQIDLNRNFKKSKQIPFLVLSRVIKSFSLDFLWHVFIVVLSIVHLAFKWMVKNYEHFEFTSISVTHMSNHVTILEAMLFVDCNNAHLLVYVFQQCTMRHLTNTHCITWASERALLLQMLQQMPGTVYVKGLLLLVIVVLRWI